MDESKNGEWKMDWVRRGNTKEYDNQQCGWKHCTYMILSIPLRVLNKPKGIKKQCEKHRHWSIATTTHPISTMTNVTRRKTKTEQDNNQPLQYQQQGLTWCIRPKNGTVGQETMKKKSEIHRHCSAAFTIHSMATMTHLPLNNQPSCDSNV